MQSGMSTACREAMAARRMRECGCAGSHASLIWQNGLSGEELSHLDVQAVADQKSSGV